MLRLASACTWIALWSNSVHNDLCLVHIGGAEGFLGTDSYVETSRTLGPVEKTVYITSLSRITFSSNLHLIIISRHPFIMILKGAVRHATGLGRLEALAQWYSANVLLFI